MKKSEKDSPSLIEFQNKVRLLIKNQCNVTSLSMGTLCIHSVLLPLGILCSFNF